MRIGIMTFHSALNCGAVLQAYALQTYLENMGHEVEFINYRIIKKKNIRDFIGKGFFKTIYKLEDIYQSCKHSKKDAFGYVLKRGELEYFSIEELQNNPPDYDVYIAGSDQIWNISSQTYLDKAYFLDFGSPSIKRIAFSASLGQCNVPKSLDQEIRQQLLKFNAISIRENIGAEYIKSIIGGKKNIQQISDPTILLDINDYLKISSIKKSKENEPYIASYILSNYNSEQLEILKYIKGKLNLNIINLRNPDTCIRLLKTINKVVTPYQWLGYIYNSEFVICCSFHAVVFSLIFHKNFIVITPNENQRILSFLKSLNMEDFIICQFDSTSIDNILEKSINWARIDNLIINERKKSINFLTNNL